MGGAGVGPVNTFLQILVGLALLPFALVGLFILLVFFLPLIGVPLPNG